MFNLNLLGMKKIMNSSNVKLFCLSALVAFGLNFGIHAQDQSIDGGGGSCTASCKSSDYLVCSIAAVDKDGHPITVLCHYMTKK